jgi:Mce-associated membrane protein
MDADRPADAAVTAGFWSAPPRWLTLLLGAVLVALLVTAGLLGWQLRDAQAAADRRAAIQRAATGHATDFLTVDHRRVRSDTANVLDGATGAFRRQYERSRSRLERLVRQNRSVSTGEVLAVGVVSSDTDSARAIVVADSDVQNTSTPQPQPRHYRLQLDLARQGERWLVSGLQFVG